MRTLLLSALAAGTLTCSQRLAAPLRIDDVVPRTLTAGTSASLTLSGVFELQVRVSFNERQRSRIDSLFTVSLGAAPATTVTWIDAGSLEVQYEVVPPAGTYELIVTNAAGETATVEITVEAAFVACTSASDCGDPCYSSPTCVDEICVLGAADKDDDGDGAVDAACSGGTDCDDDPGKCGAACAPGLAELCDGFDNDCEPGTADGSADCLDVCFSAATCEAGGCVWGVADKDSDADGAVDIACAGGTDCDDDPAGCGASCAPGLSEICDDGRDNDCSSGPDDGCYNSTPRASFTHSPFLPTPGETTTFDASASSDVDGGTLIYRWDWDDDGTFDDTSVTASTTFTPAGDYPVRLEVEDAQGLIGRARSTITVRDASSVLTVTTGDDEEDADATPGDAQGTGFSLREAIIYANATAGAEAIVIPSGTTVALASRLPALSGTDGASIMGLGSTIDAAAVATGEFCLPCACVLAQGADKVLRNLRIIGCPYAGIASTGTGTVIADCDVSDGTAGISVSAGAATVGPGNTVGPVSGVGIEAWSSCTIVDNHIHDAGTAIVMNFGSSNSVVTGNLARNNGTGVDVRLFVNGVSLLHNTIVDSTADAIGLSDQAGQTTVINNILAGNTGYGLRITDPADLADLDGNLWWNNGAGDCSGCTVLGTAAVTEAPIFVDAMGHDFRPLQSSPAIDAAIDQGLDRNGDGPGLFDGSAPDIGAFEER